jgi:hypothetical protein
MIINYPEVKRAFGSLGYLPLNLRPLPTDRAIYTFKMQANQVFHKSFKKKLFLNVAGEPSGAAAAIVFLLLANQNPKGLFFFPV